MVDECQLMALPWGEMVVLFSVREPPQGPLFSKQTLFNKLEQHDPSWGRLFSEHS